MATIKRLATIDITANTVLFLSAVYVKDNNKRFIFPRIPCDDLDEDFSLSELRQIKSSVWVFFAIATTNAQGQTLGGVYVLSLHQDYFTHVQFYGALSTVTHPSKKSGVNHSRQNVTTERCLLNGAYWILVFSTAFGRTA